MCKKKKKRSVKLGKDFSMYVSLWQISLNTYLKLRMYLNSTLSKLRLLSWKIGKKFYMGGFSNSMNSPVKTELSLEKAVTSI